jgi:hypothetical protein
MKSKFSDESVTFIPYYDSIIEKSLRGNLSEIKMNHLTQSKVRSFMMNKQNNNMQQTDLDDLKKDGIKGQDIVKDNSALI